MINKKVRSIIFDGKQKARLAPLRSQLSKSVLSSASQHLLAEQSFSDEQIPDRAVNTLLNARIRKALNNSLVSTYITVIG